MSIDSFNELKLNVFQTIEEQMSLKGFENWLYENVILSDQLHEDVVLEAYTFNYNQKDAKHIFKSTMIKYFDMDEFVLWKVKSNLLDLIEGKNDALRILNDFQHIGYDGYEFLIPIGYYLHRIEDYKYYTTNVDDLYKELKEDCTLLLNQIVGQELNKPDFKLSDFLALGSENQLPRIITRKWWRFWR